jgi:hypothetical protein
MPAELLMASSRIATEEVAGSSPANSTEPACKLAGSVFISA